MNECTMEMVDRVNQMRKTQFRKSFPHALSRFSLLHKNDNDDDEVDEKNRQMENKERK